MILRSHTTRLYAPLLAMITLVAQASSAKAQFPLEVRDKRNRQLVTDAEVVSAIIIRKIGPKAERFVVLGPDFKCRDGICASKALDKDVIELIVRIKAPSLGPVVQEHHVCFSELEKGHPTVYQTLSVDTAFNQYQGPDGCNVVYCSTFVAPPCCPAATCCNVLPSGCGSCGCIVYYQNCPPGALNYGRPPVPAAPGRAPGSGPDGDSINSVRAQPARNPSNAIQRSRPVGDFVQR
jgi:hypothetical protein